MRRVALLSVLPPLALLVGMMTSSPGQAQVTARGRVALPGGRPAAGIEVELLPQTTRYTFGRQVLEGLHYPEPAARALTAGDGSFVLEAPTTGMWMLYLAAEGYRPMLYYFLPLLEDTQVPPLELTAESTVSVRVLGSDAGPQAGARVLAELPASPQDQSGGQDDWRPAWRQAFTDSSGVARLGRARDEALHIYAYAPGHREAERPGVRANSITVHLESATVFELQIVDRRGRPVPGAQVRIGERRWPVELADESGSVHVPRVTEGEQLIEILGADGGQAERWMNPASSPPDELQRITLPRAVDREGRLLDARTKAPLAGAFAWLGGRPAGFVLTDATGTYSLSVPAEADLWVWGAAPGYLKDAAQSASATAAGPTVSLQRAARARGVVVDENDHPIANAEIVASLDLAHRAARISYGAMRQLERDVSATDGGFSIGSLHPDLSYYLRVEKPGYANAELHLPNPRSDTVDELRIALERGRVVTGVVIGPSREPIAGARVELEKSPRSGDPRQIWLSHLANQGKGRDGRTDGSGRFAIHDLASGNYTLRASAAGYAPNRLGVVEVPAAAGGTDLGEVMLQLGVHIEGRITDADGMPLEGAQVFASSEQAGIVSIGPEDDQPSTSSDASGVFSLANRRAGEKVDLRVELPGFATGSLAGVEAPTYQPVEIELHRASRVRGRVLDEAGRPIGGAQLKLQVQFTGARTRAARQHGTVTSDEDGVFLIDNVDPGEIQLTTRADGYAVNELKSLVVEPATDLDGVTVILQPGASVTGQVTDPAGQPVAFAQLMVQGSANAFAATVRHFARTDGEGRYRLEGLSAGRQSISATHDDFQPVTRELEVELGDNTLDIAFEGGVEISGRVVDSAGGAVTGARIGLETGTFNIRGGQSVVSDTSGAFSIGGLSAGTYTLRADASGFAPSRIEDLQVGPAGLSGVEVRLARGSAIVGQLYGLDEVDAAQVSIFANMPGSFSMGVVGQGGSYRIDDLPPGKYTVVARISANGLTANGEAEVFEGVVETVLDLQFDPGLTLSGQVFNGAEPLPGATLQLAGFDVGSHSSGMTDHEGRFELKGLKAGRHTLTVDSQSGLHHSEEVDITRSTEVVVRVASAKISGVVLDASDSRPLAGASVRLEPLDTEAATLGFRLGPQASTDSNGFFRFAQASVGTYRLLVQLDGYAPGELALTVSEGLDEDNLELRLSPTDGVLVYVTLPSGQQAREFSASVLDASGQTLMTGRYNSGENGARLSIPPGTWELHVAASGTAVTSVQISIPSQSIGIALEEQAGLNVRVPDLEGSTTLAKVRIIGPEGRLFRFVQWMWTLDEWPMAGGQAAVPGLPPGTWIIQVTAPDGRVWQGAASLGVGENPEVVLD